MKVKSNLGYINKLFDNFEVIFRKKIEVVNPVVVENEKKYIIFLSIGNSSIRAYVYKKAANDYSKAFNHVRKKAIDLVMKKHINPQWIKLDVVTDVKQIVFEELEQMIAKTKRNYFRYGIAFDSDFRTAFLEQEVNANAMIRSVNNAPLQLDEKNINHYLNHYYDNHLPFIKSKYRQKYVYLFKTASVFKDIDDDNIYELYNGALTNGIRTINNIEEETKRLIEKGTAFLVRQVKKNGEFEYGYFPAFAKKISTYNILRHSSTLYSMAEAYEILKEPSIIAAVEKGLEYLIQNAIVYKEHASSEMAFVVDYANENEIKLGSNATALLAMTKYMEVTQTDKYLRIAQALARGIIQMKTLSGGFIHVFTYPSFDIKDLYRIIYYEGEAIFSLLRLYAIDKNQLWLDECKQTFDYFIQKDYWKHHDHWLSYAVNELTMYDADEKYFLFGLKNCNGILDFIYHRETTYPTFLELTMATYKMCKRMKSLQKEHLFKFIDYEKLTKTIDKRAEYQRVGFFYPELAMYFKKPKEILHGFFIRHHSFRVRIDDVEHNLSGYIQYLLHRIPDVTI